MSNRHMKPYDYENRLIRHDKILDKIEDIEETMKMINDRLNSLEKSLNKLKKLEVVKIESHDKIGHAS